MQHLVEPLRDRAKGRWKGILPQLGVPATFLNGKHQPCPCCGGKDRARFDDKGGNGTWICSQCGAGTGVELVMRVNGWNFKTAAEHIESLIDSVKPAAIRPLVTDEMTREAMKHLWSATKPVQADDPVSRYLTNRLGKIAVPTALRAAGAIVYQDESGRSLHPAMIALVRGADGAAVQLHRTYLTKDGRKAAISDPRRLMPGKLPKGSAVRLADPADVLGIAEGIETALAASKIFGVPCWAAINAGNMAAWTPPSGLKEVFVFGDNDASFTGQSCAFTLAQQLTRGGASVTVHIPEECGKDWNDVLMEKGTDHG